MQAWFTRLKLSAAVFFNRLARRNHRIPLSDQCARVVMNVCALQLDRDEYRELAPSLGAYGPMRISGGAITKVTYVVFDAKADKLDKAIRQEPWRAFAQVEMRLTLERDPEFAVTLDGVEVPVKKEHTAPGLKLVQHLSAYFPLIARPHQGPLIKPEVA
jgi:hypothetical protein